MICDCPPFGEETGTAQARGLLAEENLSVVGRKAEKLLRGVGG
jgi:hypothetical protein